MTSFRVTRTSAFCIGYGVTLFFALMAIRVRGRLKSKRKGKVGFLDGVNTDEIFSDFRRVKEKEFDMEHVRLGRFQRDSTPKAMKFAKHSRGWSLSSNNLEHCSSPIMKTKTER